ncbi:MFS transporter [Streptomyces polyrhachis]|uniref:MFS transporter n=1 Tax=Streptomyces polyrhachis TaxID=1282885 RepID=A0ABW2GIG0_9ACTN
MVNQFFINLGFYMLMPYLAQHLSGTLGLAAWLTGLVLGMRNFSQQGLFLLGGALADRFGYKPLIVAGCLLRTGGFALLAFATSLPALLAATVAAGLAGALFNPAVRAYLAADAGEERRVEAFALFHVYYQAGILLGPLVGLALTGVDFRLTCAVAAGVFAVLSAVQVRALPARRGEARAGLLVQWRTVLSNRPFLLFSLAMSGSYVLTFQVYLALPLEVRRLAGDGRAGEAAVAGLFAVSGLATIVCQTRVTAWCRERLGTRGALGAGLLLMGVAFTPPMLPWPVGWPGWVSAVAATAPAALLLALGTMTAYPFEMDTVVRLAGGRLVATYYGLYQTVCGVGITLGTLATGAAMDAARSFAGSGYGARLPWVALAVLGVGCAVAVRGLYPRLDREGERAPVCAVGAD